MNVDLPTPGTPEMPTRTAPPTFESGAAAQPASSSRASARWSSRRDSTSVMAREIAALALADPSINWVRSVTPAS